MLEESNGFLQVYFLAKHIIENILIASVLVSHGEFTVDFTNQTDMHRAKMEKYIWEQSRGVELRGREN